MSHWNEPLAATHVCFLVVVFYGWLRTCGRHLHNLYNGQTCIKLTSLIKHRMKWCKLREYKWNEDVAIAVESQFKQLRSCPKSPKKTSFFFRATPQLLKLRFNCDAHFICISTVHIISFCVYSFRVDELKKLACLQCMGLHCSTGRALQRERRGHGFELFYWPGYFAIA